MRDRLPLVLFVFAVALLGAILGALASDRQWLPYRVAADGIKTATETRNKLRKKDHGTFLEFADLPAADAPQHRIRRLGGEVPAEPVLFFGGRFQFADLCGAEGCLAVEFGSDLRPVHAYPYRPEEIFRANVTEEFPYETNLFSFARDAYPLSVQRFDNGDLLVVFQNEGTFPYGGGVARIDAEGHPRWFRWDYSHHWATRVNDDRLLVPGLEIGTGTIRLMVGDYRVKLCQDGKPLLDTINVLDGDGRLTSQIRLMDKLLESPYRAVLQQTSDACDPTHLNYIETLDESAAGVEGLAPGDLVASLRNLSAFVILDPRDGTIKRLVNGTFFQQHSVHHVGGSRFLMFDNHGADPRYGPSRLLLVDVATGQETTVFPNDATPPELRKLFSETAGKVDLSPDRQRAIVAFTWAGTAVEVRLEDGAVLRVFKALGDVSQMADLDPDERRERAGLFKLYGVDYLASP
jgi:hypothetical protein